MTFFDAFYFMSYTASTIGFGELPNPFTAAQRLWVTISIYLTVIGWAYAIGSLLSLLQDRADEPVHQGAGAPGAGAVQIGRTGHRLAYARPGVPVTVRPMPVDRPAAARGALAGAVAATVWAVQQPLDKRLFGVDYDDRDVLGLAVTRGRAARPLGWVLHAANGALQGRLVSTTVLAGPPLGKRVGCGTDAAWSIGIMAVGPEMPLGAP